MKKIAIISPGFLPVPAIEGGGVETLITNIIEDNEKTPKYAFTVFSCANKSLDEVRYKYTEIIQITDSTKQLFEHQVRHAICLATGKKVELRPYAMAIRKVDWSQFDVILVENAADCYMTIEKQKGTKGKMLYHLHNDVESAGGDKSPKRIAHIVDTAKGIITVSKYIGERVCEIKRTDKIKVLYNCVDVEQFKPGQAMVPESRRKLGIRDEDFVIMYSGRITPEKGLYEVLEAAEELCRANENVKLLIVGCCWFPNVMEGPYFDKINDFVKDYKDRVKFTGYVPYEELPAYYEIASLIVVPSFFVNEAFGMVSIEAQALGKPLVVANVGGLPETVTEDFAIRIDNTENRVRDMREGFESFYSDKGKCIQMGIRARRHIENKREFHRQNYFEEFSRIIDSLDDI